MRLQFKLRESVFSAIQTQSSDPAAIDRELTDYIADVIWNSNGYNIASEDSISASIVNEIHGDLMSFGISGNIAESNRITDAILEKWQQKNLEHENEEIKTSGANESDESSDAEYLEPGACEICYRRNRTIIDEGQDEINGKTDKKTTKKLAPPFKTNSLIATQNRDRAITLFCWANSNMSKVAAATHNGKVLIIDVETGAIDNEIPVFQYIKPKASVAGNKVAEEEHFIGLHVAQGVVITCTSKGNITYHAPLKFLSSKNSNLPTVSTNVGQDALVVMRVFHDSPEYFATGGAERDLALWRAIDDKDTGTAKLENIWKAKNVPNTYLDLRVPVHITDIQFLPPLRTVPSIESVLKHNDKKSDGKKEESAIKPGRIAIVSLHKHYRIYDVSIGKRQPVLSVEVGDMPPKKLALTANGTQGIVTDTTGAALLIDSETGSRVGAFKGFHGTITDMVCATEHNEDGEKGLFITVGIDRMLRVYERDAKRRLLHQIYLKQRLHSVLVDETYVAPVQEGSKKLSSKIEKKSNKNSKVIDDEEDVDFWVRMQTEGASDDEEEIAEEAPVALERKFKTKKRRV